MSSTPHSERKPRFRALLNLSFAGGVIALSFLLVLQALLLFKGSWEVPEAILSRLHEELEERGWSADYRSLGFRPPGTVIVKDLRLKRHGEEESLASAEFGRIDFSLHKLIRGDLEIQKVTLYGGAVFCPGRLSPTGVREPVLEQSHATATQRGKRWEIHNLNGKIQNLFFTASGTIPALPERVGEPVDWEALLGQALPQIVRERDAFQQVENPRVRLRFSPGASGGLEIAAECWADAIAAPVPAIDVPLPAMLEASETIRIEQPSFATTWSYDGERWHGESVSFQAASVAWNPEFTARMLAGNLQWKPAENPEIFIPHRVDFSLGQLETPAGSLTDLHASLTLETASAFAMDFFMLFEDDPIEGKADFDWRRGDGKLEVVSRINPTSALQHEMARELGLRRDLFFLEAPFARAAATVGGWQFAGAGGVAHARQADIDGVFLHSASARAELLPDRFVAPELVLAYDDFEVEGAYEVELATKAYRLLFKGGVRPLHISAWFEDWWVNLWEEFEFPDIPLRGDVDIHGTHGHSDEVRLTGAVGARDFFLRGVPFQAVDAKLFVLGDYVDVFDIRAARSEGMAAGNFQYWADPATRQFARVDFEADSTLDPSEVAGVFGDEGREIVSDFRFTEAPALSLSGRVFGAPRESESRVTLTGESAAPLEYRGLPLEHLTVEALVEGSDWRLPQLVAGLAGGDIIGEARKWMEGDDEQLEFSLLMRGLDLQQSLVAVAGWQAESRVENPETPAVRNVKGIIDMDVAARGLSGDFQSFLGEGNLKIREADLAEVHLLGMISRILSFTPLGFTSLHFNEADAEFHLDLERLHFSDVRLTGPTSSIRAAGDYLIDQETLDFALRVYLLRESKIPLLSLLLSPLLEPLAHFTEIRLTGPAANPEWRFLLGPRNILKTMSSGEIEELDTPDK